MTAMMIDHNYIKLWPFRAESHFIKTLTSIRVQIISVECHEFREMLLLCRLSSLLSKLSPGWPTFITDHYSVNIRRAYWPMVCVYIICLVRLLSVAIENGECVYWWRDFLENDWRLIGEITLLIWILQQIITELILMEWYISFLSDITDTKSAGHHSQPFRWDNDGLLVAFLIFRNENNSNSDPRTNKIPNFNSG